SGSDRARRGAPPGLCSADDTILCFRFEEGNPSPTQAPSHRRTNRLIHRPLRRLVRALHHLCYRTRQPLEYATMTTRPRRSVLYMPGANARALEKAKTLPCDAVILDLEDSVAPEAKAAARDQVVAAVTVGGFGAREVIVRINALDTHWWLDYIAATA